MAATARDEESKLIYIYLWLGEKIMEGSVGWVHEGMANKGGYGMGCEMWVLGVGCGGA